MLIENLETNEDLTDGDIEILEALTEYIENYPLLPKIKDKTTLK